MVSKYPVSKASDPSQSAVYKNSGKTLPTTPVSLRSYYGAIENQGQIGSCTAFASLQWRGALRRQAGLTWPEPSYLANYYEERAMQNTVSTDSGATITESVQVLENNGAMPESDDPYTQDDFAKSPPNDWDASLKLDPSQALSINPQNFLNDTLDTIANGHPVLFGFEVFQEMESAQVAQTGILTMPSPNEPLLGGHAVNAIGFDPANQMILVLNQWGADWGIKSPVELQGCFWMPYAYYARYAYDAYVGLPDKTISNPKPVMTQVPSPNYGLPRGTQGRDGHQVIAVVDHIMAGTLAGTDSWFQNSSSQVSAHFGVGKDGSIHQYVDINNVAWANGVVNKPAWPLLIPNVNPNYYTVSIEHEGQSGDQFTEAQYQATLTLHRWLINTFQLEVNENTIIGHCRIDSVSRANCPGTGFPWQRLFTDLKGEPNMNYLILYYGDADLPIAADLAQNYQCPLVQAAYASTDLLASAKNKFQVGGSSAPQGVTLLAGADRFDTMKTVLKAMGKI